MKAAIYYGPKNLRVEEVEIPKPNNSEVMVKVKSTGVCGTDPHMYQGNLPIVKSNVILGHEGAGIIEDIGSDVKNVNVGDTVCVNSLFSCGECWFCKNGKKNLCGNIQIIGCTRNGTYAEYANLPVESIYKFNGKISFDEAAMADPLACSLHGIERANIKPGDSVVVIGAGPIGLMQLQLSKIKGATKLFSIDKVDYRLQLAKEFGAICLKPENAVTEVKSLTEGLGADIVIESSGSIEGAQKSLEMVKNGGRIVIFGAPPEKGEIKIRPYDFYLKELEIVGSFISIFDFYRAIKLIEERVINVKSLITHRFPLTDVEEALKIVGAKRDNVIKAIVYS